MQTLGSRVQEGRADILGQHPGGNLGGLGLPWERGSLFSVYFCILGMLFKFCSLCASCLSDNNF